MRNNEPQKEGKNWLKVVEIKQESISDTKGKGGRVFTRNNNLKRSRRGQDKENRGNVPRFGKKETTTVSVDC